MWLWHMQWIDMFEGCESVCVCVCVCARVHLVYSYVNG